MKLTLTNSDGEVLEVWEIVDDDSSIKVDEEDAFVIDDLRRFKMCRNDMGNDITEGILRAKKAGHK